jgi:hypothetical protein
MKHVMYLPLMGECQLICDRGQDPFDNEGSMTFGG